jgi:hypothetical protein
MDSASNLAMPAWEARQVAAAFYALPVFGAKARFCRDDAGGW